MRMKPAYLAAVSGLAFGLALSLSPTDIFGGEAAKGQPLYEKHCLLCHGPEGRGDGPLSLRLDPAATNFHHSTSNNKSDAELFKTIREGHRETAMASWKTELSEEELLDILAYIRKLSGGPGTGPGDRG